MAYQFLTTLVNTVSDDSVMWEDVRFNIPTKEDIVDYLEDKPMPKSTTYISETEFIDDVLRAGGVVSIRDDESEEFKRWFIGFVDNFS